jgi:hypothetical protein
MWRANAIYACPACAGRGWSFDSDKRLEWAESCKSCGGIGRFTLYRLADKLEEDPETLQRVAEGRSRSATCHRVLQKIVRNFPCLLPPSKSATSSSDRRQESLPFGTSPGSETGRFLFD